MSVFKPTALHGFLQEKNLRPRKALSQNFLIDGNIIRKIIAAAMLEKEDLVIEIGSGPGALTEAILNHGCEVIAIEKDPSFAASLERFQTKERQLMIFQEDFLSFPLEKTLKDLKKDKKVKVVANLPYHITTPAILRLLPLYRQISSLTLMVQKEVAIRLTAKKNTPEYGSITLFTSFYSAPSYCFTVEPTCFFPRPKVKSSIVHFTLRQPPIENLASDFFQLTRCAFQQRRKMLRGSLKSLYASEKVQEVLVALGLPCSTRPEELSLDEFLKLFIHLR
jgi:16S rRNA (adenine1518-N6/adenine1519-N6)-dimethyltransferase